MRSTARLPRRFAVRGWRVASFLVYFGREFLVANAQVLRESLLPGRRSVPAIVAVPLRSRTSREIVTIANLVTLTPGTLALELDLDPPMLYVHGMFVTDPAAFLADLRQLEARMLGAFRPADSADGDAAAGPTGARPEPMDRR
jgi:multicomponent Na+:H+ antiporter subunit E